MNSFLKILLIGIGLLLCFNAFAQENLPDTLRYKMGLDLTGTRATGVFSTTTVRVGTNVNLKNKKWTFNNSLSYQFNNINGLTIRDNWLEVAYIQYHLGGKWNWFPLALYQFETNVIYQVKDRHRFGTGIGAYPLDKNGYSIRFTTGWFYESELYGGDRFVNSDLIDARRKNHSAWLHLTNKIPIAKTKGELELDFWYFQSFKEGNDYSLSILPKLRVKLNKYLSFHVRYDWRFENVYLEPLVDLNDLLLFGVNVKFAN